MIIKTKFNGLRSFHRLEFRRTGRSQRERQRKARLCIHRNSHHTYGDHLDPKGRSATSSGSRLLSFHSIAGETHIQKPIV